MDGDKATLQNLEEVVIAPSVGVTNFTNLKDVPTQELNVTSLENNFAKNGDSVDLPNKTEHNRNTDNAGASQLSMLKNHETTINSTSDNASKQAAKNCMISEACLSILDYGDSSSSSSSEDSEPDSQDMIQDSKSSDSSDSEWEEIPSNNDIINNVKNYRERCSSSGDSSDSDESLDHDFESGAAGAVKPLAKKGNRTEGDLELDDLPPVPDLSKLSLNVKTEDCIQMGKIFNIIDRLVTVESLPNTPAFDLDTLLFLDQGKEPLGYVYDVIGQVTSPIYVIRFNSKEEIESQGITKGMPVYSAPNTKYTQFVFLKQLLQMKGSDASWQGDNEVPVEFLDYSDDDIEHDLFRGSNGNEKVANPRRKKRNSLDRHKMFETAMNIKNEVNSAQYETRDSSKPPSKKTLKFRYHQPPPSGRVLSSFHHQGFNNYVTPNFTMPPNFNMMNMPPPMFNMHSYPMMQFPPNPQFPSPTFGSPIVPPLPPHVSHVHAQPPPPGYQSMLPTSMPIGVCKPVSQLPNMHQNPGVLPKARPFRYSSPAEYQFPNSSAPRDFNPFLNVRQNPPSFGQHPYGPVQGPYNIPFSKNNGGSHFKHP